MSIINDKDWKLRLHPSDVDFAIIERDAVAGKSIAVLTVTDEDGPLGGKFVLFCTQLVYFITFVWFYCSFSLTNSILFLLHFLRLVKYFSSFCRSIVVASLWQRRFCVFVDRPKAVLHLTASEECEWTHTTTLWSRLWGEWRPETSSDFNKDVEG